MYIVKDLPDLSEASNDFIEQVDPGNRIHYIVKDPRLPFPYAVEFVINYGPNPPYLVKCVCCTIADAKALLYYPKTKRCPRKETFPHGVISDFVGALAYVESAVRMYKFAKFDYQEAEVRNSLSKLHYVKGYKQGNFDIERCLITTNYVRRKPSVSDDPDNFMLHIIAFTIDDVKDLIDFERAGKRKRPKNQKIIEKVIAAGVKINVEDNNYAEFGIGEVEVENNEFVGFAAGNAIPINDNVEVVGIPSGEMAIINANDLEDWEVEHKIINLDNEEEDD